MRRKFLLLLLSLTACTCTFARDYEARIGHNIASMTAYKDVVGKTGMHLGLFTDFQMAKYLYFQPGVLLNQKGAKEGTFRAEIDDVRATYVDFPLFLSLRFPLSQHTKFRINLGPYLAFGIGGKGLINDPKLGHKTERSTFTSIVDSRFDYGSSFETGMEFHRCYLGLGLSGGFAASKNLVLSVSFGYKFSL